MLEALGAGGPHPANADRLMLFGRLVGAWDVDYTVIAANGSRTTRPAEWLFGWVLQGRAVQDVLLCPPRGTGGETFECGTTLRFYDAESDVWQVTWVTPPYRAVVRMVAGAENGGIVLRGQTESGRRLRWTFTDMSDDRFTWRGFFSDDGASWTQDEEMLCRRRAVLG